MSSAAVPIVVLCADLFFASQIEGAGQIAVVPVRMVDDVEAAVRTVRELGARLLIVDLENPGLDLLELMEQLGAQRPQLLGFYPHVRKDRFEAAQAAGFDRVISRGQFSTQLVDILKAG